MCRKYFALAGNKFVLNNQPCLLFCTALWFIFVGSTKALCGPESLIDIICNSLAWKHCYC